MTDNQAFEIEGYPKDGRLAKYEKELLTLFEKQDNEGIIAFCNKLFCDCAHFLKEKMKLNFPNLALNFLNHKDFTELCDKIDAQLGAIPRTKAIIARNNLSPLPQIYIDFEDHFKGKPIEIVANLCVSYIEELIHSSDPSKSETQIHETVCTAIEHFLEIKLSNGIKENRLAYAKKCDEIKS
jgi:hypothetical protein